MNNSPGLTDYLMVKAAGMNIPINGSFELLPICNFNCEYCYINSPFSAKMYEERRTSAEDWIRVLDQARENGLLYLLLTGGEPLLYEGFEKIYERSARSGIIVSVNTNGTLINREVAETFRKNLPKQINISLYGTNNGIYRDLCGARNGFDRVDRAVKLLKEFGIPFKFNCVVNKKNAGDIENIIWYAKETGTVADLTTYVYPPVRNESASFGANKRLTCEEAAGLRLKIYRLTHSDAEYRLFLENIVSSGARKSELSAEKCDGESKYSCRAGKSGFWVNWKLEMTACGMTDHPSEDLKTQLFSEAWRKISETWKEYSLPQKCLSCPMAPLCGVCKASAYAESGNHSGVPEYICETADRLVILAKQELKRS